MTKKLDEARKERDFLKDLNASLLRNQADLQKGLAAAEAQVKSISAEKQATVSDLQEQVHFPASRSWFSAKFKWTVKTSDLTFNTPYTRHVCVQRVVTYVLMKLHDTLDSVQATMLYPLWDGGVLVVICSQAYLLLRVLRTHWQVRDLMVYIEVGRTVASNGDLQDAQVLPVPVPPPVVSKRSARR